MTVGCANAVAKDLREAFQESRRIWEMKQGGESVYALWLVQVIRWKLPMNWIHYKVAKNLADFMENTLNRDGGLKYYDIDFRSSCMLWKLDILGGKRKRITVGDFEGFEVLLPRKLIMGRPKNPIWNQVTIIAESEKERKWLCNRCRKQYAGGATRINEHLGITKGKGNITLCPRRHDLLANEGVNNSMLPGSSNQMEAPNEFGLNNGVLPASSNQLEDSNGLDSLTGFELADPMNSYHEKAEGHRNMISACFDGPIDQNDVAGPSNMVEGTLPPLFWLPRTYNSHHVFAPFNYYFQINRFATFR
ncbi:hypothetical protein AHAS_Ahas20G0321900 [Arachis hypogaea]